MTRACRIATFVIASGTAVLVSVVSPLQRYGLEVPASEAASIRGGQCGSYQMIATGACTDATSDTCTSSSSDCDGLCPLVCSPQSTYGGSGTFTGALAASTCDPALQSTCTE